MLDVRVPVCPPSPSGSEVGEVAPAEPEAALLWAPGRRGQPHLLQQGKLGAGAEALGSGFLRACVCGAAPSHSASWERAREGAPGPVNVPSLAER